MAFIFAQRELNLISFCSKILKKSCLLQVPFLNSCPSLLHPQWAGKLLTIMSWGNSTECNRNISKRIKWDGEVYNLQVMWLKTFCSSLGQLVLPRRRLRKSSFFFKRNRAKNKKCLVCFGNVTDIRNFPFPSSLQDTETRYFVLWNALYVSRLKCNYYDRNEDN